MKTPLMILMSVAFLLGERPGRAVEPAKGFEKFLFVRTRNVFDPERKPMAAAQGASASKTTGNRPSAVTLTGTMATEGKSLAFFASARGEFNKVVNSGETIAGFRVKSISPGIIEIESAGKAQVLAVGEALPIPGAAPAGSEPEAANPETSPSPDGSAAPAAVPVPGSPEDVMKRMLERRQKEMSR